MFNLSRLLLMIVAMAIAGTALAGYSVHDVYQAAESGRMQEAQVMMQQVLREHPESAKAHYVQAQLYVKAGQLDYARRELNTARRLDPKLAFATPTAVNELQARLSSPRFSNGVAPTAFPWRFLIIAALLLAVVAYCVRVLLRRNAVQAGTAVYNSGMAYGSAPMYQPPMYPSGTGGYSSGGMGSGIIGGLATGAAVGAGIVAGEALANRFMGDHQHSSPDPTPSQNITGQDWSGDNLGGNNFGIDDATSWDDGGDFAGNDWN